MKTKEEVLQNCTVEGMVVKLPSGQLDRKLYQEVAKSLELIGGKWKGNKIMGFVFSQDPTELLEQISNGEKRNLKKEFQFFATPIGLVRDLVKLAELDSKHMILEPSAGQGAIVNEILSQNPDAIVHAYELMDINRTFLNKIPDCIILGNDFMERDTYREGSFDRIIANPPFTKNQDIDHVQQMYDSLKVGGRLVSVMSRHFQHCDNKKETAFRQWLDEVNADIINVEAGTFKESGTMIASLIVVINK